jgi:hypothetical protein
VSAATQGTTAVTVSLQPNTDGSFRVIVGGPSFSVGTAATLASTLLGGDATAANLESAHDTWWHNYWGRVRLVKMTSTDGSAEYIENLRAIYL